MTIGELRAAISGMDDALVIVLAVTIEDADGDDTEQWFGVDKTEVRRDPDTAEEYAHFAGGELFG